jgi:hypothetical protein
MPMLRGEVIWDGQTFLGRAGQGAFLQCASPSLLARRMA